MFEFTESVLITAPLPVVWDALQDLENWWPASNPEHESIERLDDGGNQVGAVLRVRERIAGVPGVAVGTITHVDPLASVTWDAPKARYRILGVPFTIGEGVTWSVQREPDSSTRLGAHVWATFPGPFGWLLQWSFTHLFRGVERDREHARTELRYLKRILEANKK